MHPALENVCIIDNHHCSITIKLMRVEYVQLENQILLLIKMGISALFVDINKDERGD